MQETTRESLCFCFGQRIFAGNLVVTTVDLSTNRIGEAGAHALAHGLIAIKERGLTDRAPMTVLLSRNRFGQEGANVIRQALVNSGSRHVFRMEGVRPGFGISTDAGAPALDVSMKYELMEVLDLPSASRPSTNMSRKGRAARRPISPLLSRQPTHHSSHRSAAYSTRRHVMSSEQDESNH